MSFTGQGSFLFESVQGSTSSDSGWLRLDGLGAILVSLPGIALRITTWLRFAGFRCGL